MWLHFLGKELVDPHLQRLAEESGASKLPKAINDAALIELTTSIVCLLIWPVLVYLLIDDAKVRHVPLSHASVELGICVFGFVIALIGLISGLLLQRGGSVARWTSVAAAFIRIFIPIPIFGAILALPTIYGLALNRESRRFYRERAQPRSPKPPALSSRPFNMPDVD